MVRFLVSDFGISWVESRNGRELVKLEGAEAIQELQRMTDLARQGQPRHQGALTHRSSIRLPDQPVSPFPLNFWRHPYLQRNALQKPGDASNWR